jgi:hypothetical protein
MVTCLFGSRGKSVPNFAEKTSDCQAAAPTHLRRAPIATTRA